MEPLEERFMCSLTQAKWQNTMDIGLKVAFHLQWSFCVSMHAQNTRDSLLVWGAWQQCHVRWGCACPMRGARLAQGMPWTF